MFRSPQGEKLHSLGKTNRVLQEAPFTAEGGRMINVEAEVNKHKNCKDRDELVWQIKEYKNLALQNASDIVMAGQYNMVALKLQEICDKLPAPRLKRIPGNTPGAPVKTATITNEENAKISVAWRKRATKDDKH